MSGPSDGWSEVEKKLRDNYETKAPEYDEYLSERRVKHETRSLLELADVQVGEVFLDAACGTGRMLTRSSLMSVSACGVDLSRAMLDVLKRKDKSRRLNLVLATTRCLPFRHSSFSVVTCAGLTGYYELGKICAMLCELKRVLHDGGRVAVDFLVKGNVGSCAIQKEEAEDGADVFLQAEKDILSTVRSAGFNIAAKRTTESQLQLLILAGR